MSLVDLDFIKKNITTDNGPEVPYLWSHGASSLHVGDGIVLYALIQQLRAKTCVCLGSGGGFIPRIMTQARRDLHSQGIFEGDSYEIWGNIGGTWVVDACNGVGGHVTWESEDSFYRSHFSPCFIKDTTENAYYNYFSLQNFKLDIVHIDADHSYEGVRRDFYLYSKLLSPGGVITLHDTDLTYERSLIVPESQKKDWDRFDGPGRFLEELEYSGEWNTVNLFNYGKCPGKPASTGLTIVQRSREYQQYLNSLQ